MFMRSFLVKILHRKIKRIAVIVGSFFVSYIGVLNFARFYRKSRRLGRILVLTYHNISEPYTFRGSSYVSPDAFRQQMSYLRKRYKVVGLETIRKIIDNGQYPTEDFVAITFDDGCLDNYTNALPILKEFNIPATIFVATGLISGEKAPWWIRFDYCIKMIGNKKLSTQTLNILPNSVRFFFRSFIGRYLIKAFAPEIASKIESMPEKKRDLVLNEISKEIGFDFANLNRSMCTWEDLRALSDAGIEIGAHTHNHVTLGYEIEETAEREIRTSVELIRHYLGKQNKYFAYPGGFIGSFNKKTRKLLAQNNIELGFTYVRGEINPNDDPLELKRIGVSNYPLFVFKTNLSGVLDIFR